MTNRDQYHEYLQSEHWHNLRRQAFNRVGHMCENCRSPHRLHGHHLIYRDLYNCTIDDIMALCESCHDRWHQQYSSGVRVSREVVLAFLRKSAVNTKPVEIRPRKHKKPKKDRSVQKQVKVALNRFYQSHRTKRDMNAFIAALTHLKSYLVD